MQLNLDIHRELIIDNFAGGGGASTGIELAIGRRVDVAINHDPEAVAMHTANHPETRHYCESVWEVNPREIAQGRPVGLVWLSPDCKHFSKAKGGKPVEKKIRGLAWVALRWAATVRPRVIMLENVEEFVTWGPLTEDADGKMRPCPKRKGREFGAFTNALRRHGYAVEWRELRACDYGAPTIRKRLFLIARRDGQPIVWPAPTHGDPKSAAVKAKKLKPWRTAAECIDWSLPTPSIFERAKPLADATCRRIAKGIMRYVVEAAAPFIVGAGGPTYSGKPVPVSSPFGTLTVENHRAVVTAFMAKHYGGVVGHGLHGEPLHTVTGTDHNSLVTATLDKREDHTTEVRAFLVKYYGNEQDGVDMTEPMHTVTARDRFGLVTVAGEEYAIVDIGLRMLAPRELYRAQGFPEHYIIGDDPAQGLTLTKSAQVRMCGNSVCPPLAAALVRANVGDMAIRREAA